MVFSSYLFLIWFLPIACLVYAVAPARFKNLTLAVVSYVFYAWANPWFVLLMLTSTAIDYFCGRMIERSRQHALRSKLFLTVSICSNLGLLGFFKYFNFATDSLAALAAAFALDASVFESSVQVALPLGISFYTFQSMSYTIDVYRGQATAMRNPIDFACYVSMFPQLVAGPIVRFKEIQSQLLERKHSWQKISLGISFFAIGLGKKVLLANPCGKMADIVFAAASTSVLDTWLGVVAYSMQIYFDFSGYSDMAIGLGLFFGFRLPKNFASPYQAASITEFWQRWHISLSSWLRDYLYIPLGGNRCGKLRNLFNLMTVMLLGGLWHGASWNFVLWGAMHGSLLSWDRIRKHFKLTFFIPRPLQIALTYIAVLLTWVPFRANSFEQMGRVYANMFGLGISHNSHLLVSAQIYQPYPIVILLVSILIVFGCHDSQRVLTSVSIIKSLGLVVLLWVAVAMLMTQSFNPFIYFIF